MCAGKSPRCELVSFLQAAARRTARLAVKETAFRCLEQQTIRIVTLRGNVRVKAFVVELRSQYVRVSDDVAVLKVRLIPALMKIRCRRLRGESVQAKKIELLRVHRKRGRGGLLRCNDEVQLRVGIKTLQCCIALQRWKAVDGGADVAILERLCDGDAPFHNWTRERHPRCSRAYASDGSVAVAQPWHEVLEREMEFVVVACFRSDGGNCSG